MTKERLKGENMKNETKEQKEIRMFNFYKKYLEKLNEKNNFIRFNVIEYVCSFPKINPYKMAATLSAEGIKIVYDDSSISRVENERKERKVKRLTA